MVDNPEIIKGKIRDSIANTTPYFLPLEKIDPDIKLEDFLQTILAEPSEVLGWVDSFSLNQSFKVLISSLGDDVFDLRITSFTCFAQGNLQLSFNTSSQNNTDQGFLQAVGIDTSDLSLGNLIELQNIGLSLSYEPKKASG